MTKETMKIFGPLPHFVQTVPIFALNKAQVWDLGHADKSFMTNNEEAKSKLSRAHSAPVYS